MTPGWVECEANARNKAAPASDIAVAIDTATIAQSATNQSACRVAALPLAANLEIA